MYLNLANFIIFKFISKEQSQILKIDNRVKCPIWKKEREKCISYHLFILLVFLLHFQLILQDYPLEHYKITMCMCRE